MYLVVYKDESGNADFIKLSDNPVVFKNLDHSYDLDYLLTGRRDEKEILLVKCEQVDMLEDILNHYKQNVIFGK